MATPIPMPKLGLTMEEGTILKWLKSDGEAVNKGEMILLIQTDKVEYEVESPDEGVILKTFSGEGDVVPCGENIAVIGVEGEDISDYAPKVVAAQADTPPASETPAIPAPAAVNAPSVNSTVAPSQGGRIFASPAARRLAREMGIDYCGVRGTGPGGRIVQADVQAAASGGATSAAPYAPPAAQSGPPAVAATSPVAGVRKVIVERMAASWDQVPRITLQAEVDLTNLLAVREASKLAWEADLGVKVSINDLIVF
ncbi:MAG: pyruvate dehydrogenase complex dihydrolipoamide acetyltransferase, partial [Nitrospinaceae bacterium]|nr:pyruvate dehydrogenase complex dihydrolipoamide acetyltransferase [Nitrospinaceae bacterium]